MQVRNFRDNVLAGLFVVGGLAIAVWGSFLIGDQGAGGGLQFLVRFSLKEGATGLKEGSEVLLGGIKVGRVNSVIHETKDGVPTDVLVGVEVSDSLKLRDDASIVLERPLLGTLSSINIISAGENGAPITTDTKVNGNLAPPAFLASAGLGEKEVTSLQNILSRAESATKNLDEMMAAEGKVRKIIESVDEMLAKVSPKVDDWSTDVTKTLASIRATGEKLPGIADDAKSFVADGRKTLESAQQIIDENRAEVKETVTHARNVAKQIDENMLKEFSEVMTVAQSGIGDFAKAVGTVEELVTEGRGDIKNTLTEMSLGAQEMRFAIAEIRAQPWRIMHKPSLKERETEDLYAAAHVYARAAAQLRSTSDSIAGLLRDDSLSESGKAALERLKTQLDQDVQSHRDAGKKLMDELIESR